jgi:hypothetical protein
MLYCLEMALAEASKKEDLFNEVTIL